MDNKAQHYRPVALTFPVFFEPTLMEWAIILTAFMFGKARRFERRHNYLLSRVAAVERLAIVIVKMTSNTGTL
jgi:hypothetical protein